jgi:hypothetical protein
MAVRSTPGCWLCRGVVDAAGDRHYLVVVGQSRSADRDLLERPVDERAGVSLALTWA